MTRCCELCRLRGLHVHPVRIVYSSEKCHVRWEQQVQGECANHTKEQLVLAKWALVLKPNK